MATITITTNLKDVLGQVSEKLKLLSDPKTLLLPAAQEAISLIHPRIHVRGQASDGGQIGLYSKGYLAIRSGAFRNTPRITRGVNKGKLKPRNAGVFTSQAAENKIGTARPVFNRGTDPKVIASLTRQMEDDYVVVPIEEDAYGVGFTNSVNFDKSQHVEKIYAKKIFSLTVDEEGRIKEFIENLVNEVFKA